MGKSEKIKDELFVFKYIGYCYAFLPPKECSIEYKDFLNYAKFQLCQIRNILLNDPVWNKYSDEELLCEYFAVTYSNNPSEKEKFEGQLLGLSPDTHDWFDKMIDKNKKELEQKFKEKEDLIIDSSEILDDE